MALITTLIDKQDTNEIVRDQVAAILAIEKENQKVLASAAGKDPDLWDFSVFIERAKPWSAFSDDAGNEEGDVKNGLVNVFFDSDNFDNAGSDVIREQTSTGIIYIDCYGFKNSVITDKNISGFGDELASREVDRIARLVRNILMAGAYTYLALGRDASNIVQKRYVSRRTKFFPQEQQNGEFNVIAERIALNVQYREFSPQVELDTLETLIMQCTRGDDGEVYFDYEA